MFIVTRLVFGLMSVHPKAEDPNPTPYLPSGPNFQLFAGLAPTIQWIIGSILAVVFFIGLFLLISGVSRFRTRNRDTGEGAKGIGRILSGIVMIAGSFILIPIINLLIGVAQSAGHSIH